MNCEVYCSLYVIIKESFVKCGTSRGAFFCLFSLVFSNINCLFPSPSHICLFGGVRDSDTMCVFTFSAKDT